MKGETRIWPWLLVWGILDLLCALFCEIHADEAYYRLYGQFLSWGYFDHPPMVGLMTALSGSNGLTDGTFVMLYNMTHGFKYIEMLCAILLGVVMTGIFLSDPYLRIASLVILVLFMLAFGVFQMQTVSLMGRSVGIVWTSLIYHATETLGLFLLSLYLSRKYRGL